ncbi:hydroxyacid dehydrogenase [Bauldia sp.]|uniref:hydroxyacid dehydrogenase n=1 Tax=Bauldia sp. TaxID=2575872 RepID=UPI003BAB8ACF
MHRVLLTEPIHDDGMALLRARDDVEIVPMPDTAAETFTAMLPGTAAMIIRTVKLPSSVLGAADILKVVCRHGVGYDNIPVAALTERGIPLALAIGSNAPTVAEHVFFLMLTVAKHGLPYDRAVRRGAWEDRSLLASFDLRDRTLLLIGFGRIGRSVAQMAAAFSMRVLAFDPAVSAEEMTAGGAEKIEDWRAVLGAVDVVSLHVPFLPETDTMIGAKEIAAMKPDAILVNAARGGLIDEDALAAALNEGRLAGAGIDTFRDEPPVHGSPLLDCERVVLSPHVAGLTKEAAARLSVYSAQNALDAIDGRLDPAFVVNQSVLQP